MTDTDLIGHNRPDPSREILDRLALDYGQMADSIAEHETAAGAIPAELVTKDDHDRAADLISRMRGTFKTVEATRVAEKEPFLKSERAVDGYFDPLKSRLKITAEILTERVDGFLKRKAAEVRLIREAAEAEERRKAAVLRAEQDERERKAADAKRRDHQAAHAEAARVAAESAAEAENRAAEHEAAAAVKPAEMARTRSDTGTLSTLRSEWTHTTEDAALIPLDTLRPYISTETVEKAIRAYVKMGGRQLPGVRIYETTKAQVR